MADELLRQTGEPFDVHGQIRKEPTPLADAVRRWQDEVRPLRELILAKLEPFRAAGHKSLEAKVTVTPTASQRGQWQRELANLLEMTVVSQLELTAHDAAIETEIMVSEAGGPECPRCWRRTGSASGLRRGAKPLHSLRRRGQLAGAAMSPAKRRTILFTVTAVVSLVLDQWTKVLARTDLKPLASWRVSWWLMATSTCATRRTPA